MKRRLIIASIMSASCSQMEKADTAAVANMAQESAIRDLERRVADLEAKTARQAEQISTVRDVAISTSSAHDSLVKTFNGNVDKENKAKVARLTQSGYCGQERVNYPDGSWTIQNKECTLKDLRP